MSIVAAIIGIAAILILLGVIGSLQSKLNAAEDEVEMALAARRRVARYHQDFVERHPRYLTQQEVADLCGIASKTLGEYVRRGLFPAADRVWRCDIANEAAQRRLKEIVQGKNTTKRRKAEAERLLWLQWRIRLYQRPFSVDSTRAD